MTIVTNEQFQHLSYEPIAVDRRSRLKEVDRCFVAVEVDEVLSDDAGVNDIALDKYVKIFRVQKKDEDIHTVFVCPFGDF